ncbi:MAG: translocation/assembly module TamB domain-containing protein [Bacteroidales bacterium]|nr:translocation/assembly module TamB domain-containing protein [Bacteroidales bacterium]
MQKVIKYIRRFIVGTLLLLASLYGIIYITVSLPSVQGKMKQITTEQLSQLLNTHISIENVSIRPFNKLTIEGILLKDLSNDTLFYSNKLTTSFSILPLLKKEIKFSGIQLVGFDMRLNKPEPTSPLNLQFVIDAFASKDTIKKEMPYSISLNSIILRRGSFKYDVLSAPEKKSKFDASHIDISDFLASMSLKSYSSDTLNVNFKRLSFKEKSGFELNNLNFELAGNRDSTLLKNLNISLPDSKLNIDTLKVKYSRVKDRAEFFEKCSFDLRMERSDIYLKDISAFAPVLKHFDSPISLEMKANGSPNNIQTPLIRVEYGEDLSINAEAVLTGLSNPNEAFLYGSVKDLRLTPKGLIGIANNFSSDKKNLPKIIEELGILSFKGSISGFFSNLVAFGNIKSRLGTIQADILLGNDLPNNLLTYKGNVKTSDFYIGGLIPSNKDLGKISFSLFVDGRQQKGFQTRGVVKGDISKFDYKGYIYKNLAVNGNFLGKSFDGAMKLDDPNGKIDIAGKFVANKDNSTFDFGAKVRNLKLDKLKIISKYKDSDLSFDVKANFAGNKIDNAQGDVVIDSLCFINNDISYSPGEIVFSANNNEKPQILRVESKPIAAQIKGTYNFSTLVRELKSTLAESMPVLENENARDTKINDFDFTVNIRATDSLSKVLNLPVNLTRESNIWGYYNSDKSLLKLEGSFPEIKVGKMIFEDANIIADNPDDKVKFRLTAKKLNKKNQILNLSLNADADKGVLKTKFDWSNLALATFSGNFVTETSFNKREGKYPFQTIVDILPSTLIFNDTIWNVNKSKVVIDSAKVKVSDFEVKHDAQHLRLNGIFSDSPMDSLELNLFDMNLDYIFETLNINYVKFGGRGTGDFLVTHNNKDLVLKTDSLKVKDFSYQGVQLGDLKVYSDFDKETKGITLKGIITQPDARPTNVNGGIFVGNDSLWLNFDANRIKVDFAKVWTEKILKDLKGRASGNLTLYGKFKALNIVGDAYGENVGFGIDYLNTYYTISDSIKFTTNGIFFNNVTLYDFYQNRANATGAIKYHNFKDIEYDISMSIPDASQFLVYNQTEKMNPIYWGTIFGAGSGRVYGSETQTWIDVTMRTQTNSKFNFSLNDEMTAGDYQFITFHNKDEERIHYNDSITGILSVQKSKEEKKSSHELFINLQVEATPDGTINLIMDPSAGDAMKGNGYGNIRLEYSDAASFKMYGNYTIEKGSYYFNLQDVITRDFTIKQGSSVNFRGEPMNSELDIKAVYQVTANLTDLDESFSTSKELSRPNVPVQCVLNISGDLQRPDLSFDINLPTVSQDIDRQVKSIISTDEMMNRQILYLMILNKFYTPDYVNNGQMNRYNELASVASSTLSSQLNNLLGQLSDNWNIGTNIRSDKGDFSDVEVELALSSQLLNNRLLFNGNLGYRDDPNASNSFIGDFDLEYLLNKSGSLRLKAYNHYNDRNYSVKSALTTQGVGVMFKKDFENFADLYSVFWKNNQKKNKSVVVKSDSTMIKPENGEIITEKDEKFLE